MSPQYHLPSGLTLISSCAFSLCLCSLSSEVNSFSCLWRCKLLLLYLLYGTDRALSVRSRLLFFASPFGVSGRRSIRRTEKSWHSTPSFSLCMWCWAGPRGCKQLTPPCIELDSGVASWCGLHWTVEQRSKTWNMRQMVRFVLNFPWWRPWNWNIIQ